MLTDTEIIELEQLLKIEELNILPEEVNINYKYLKQQFEAQKYVGEELKEGSKGCVLEGGARSGKTYSSLYYILYICLHVEETCVINIVRETYNEFKTTLYLDFKKILREFGLPNPFETAKDVQSFYIGKNQINFMGADQPSKVHGATLDYLYFNEVLTIDQAVFKNLTMRCNKFWISDFNPSVTEHWIFNEVITRDDVQ